MANVIIILIIVVIAIFAIRESMKHFKGQGGCCGGGDAPKSQEKKLDAPKVDEKIIHIEGMHCENCKNRVEAGINQIDGASCKVNLGKKIAVVAMSRMISDDEIKTAVEKLDFKVTGVERK